MTVHFHGNKIGGCSSSFFLKKKENSIIFLFLKKRKKFCFARYFVCIKKEG
jgi:hypothetical protein